MGSFTSRERRQTLSELAKGRYGIFPVTGRPPNVRKTTSKNIIANETVKNLKLILGVEDDKIYVDSQSLRYGGVMIMTDQDIDGYHIKGLLINIFHFLWPSLLRRGSFLSMFSTPLVKATSLKTGRRNYFYSMPEFEFWKASNSSSEWKIFYLKGLAANSFKDFKYDLDTVI